MKKLLAGSLLAVSSLLAGDVLAVVGGEEITKTQRDNGLKTDDDVTVMRNSKKDSEFDIKICEIEIKLLLNSLLAKVSG